MMINAIVLATYFVGVYGALILSLARTPSAKKASQS